MSEQLQILKLVVERLENAGIGYMISGSIAVSYYAEPRFTRDIDMVVELEMRDGEQLIEILEPDFYFSKRSNIEITIQRIQKCNPVQCSSDVEVFT